MAGLFRAYAASLPVDLAYQGFEAELRGLPGPYAPPRGALLLAGGDGGALGCAGLRPAGRAEACELKRLYVRPEGRGERIGEALLGAAIAAAGRFGYLEMLLVDTLPSMAAAQALYRRHGFETIAPYYDSPVAGTVFMRRALTR